MLKNLLKAAGFDFYSHYCSLKPEYIFNKGWMDVCKCYEVSLQKLFQHVCLQRQVRILQLTEEHYG
jgi:hypothetical protein